MTQLNQARPQSGSRVSRSRMVSLSMLVKMVGRRTGLKPTGVKSVLHILKGEFNG